MNTTGILLDDNHDLQVRVKRDSDELIKEGVVLGNITFQNQELIILSEKGEFKEAPLKGVGIYTYMDDEAPDSLLRAIRTELSNEEMTVDTLRFNNDGLLIIEAQYQ